MNYLFDTNLLSELTTKNPNVNVVAWVESIDQENIFLSVVAIGEFKKGIEKLPGSRRKKDLISWLENDLLIRFRERVIPLDLPVMLVWGTMVAELEKAGTPLPAIDSLLAASASQRGLTLVTRNTKDFEPAGIPLINPWIV